MLFAYKWNEVYADLVFIIQSILGKKIAHIFYVK